MFAPYPEKWAAEEPEISEVDKNKTEKSLLYLDMPKNDDAKWMLMMPDQHLPPFWNQVLLSQGHFEPDPKK